MVNIPSKVVRKDLPHLPNSYPTFSVQNDDFLVKGVSRKTHIYLKLKITFGKGYDKKFWLS